MSRTVVTDATVPQLWFPHHASAFAAATAAVAGLGLAGWLCQG